MKIRKSRRWIILLIVLFVPFVEPTYVLGQLPSLHRLYDIMKMASFSIILLFVVLRKHRMSKYCGLIIAFYSLLLILTILNGFSLTNTLRIVVPAVAVCLLIDMFIIDKRDQLLTALTIVLMTLTIINFVTIIMYPNGMYTAHNDALGNVEQNWFLGYKNPQIRLILPAVACATINSYCKKGKISVMCYFLYAIATISAVLVDSATALVAILLFGMLIFVVDHFAIGRFMNVKNFFLISVVSYVFILSMGTSQIVSNTLEAILGRDVTFTGRSIIWLRCLTYYLNGHLGGIGIATSAFMFATFACSHPHNYYLYVLLQGGIVGMIIIVHLIVSVSKQLVKYYKKTAAAFVFTIVLGVFLVMGIAESLTEAVMLYPMFVLAGNIEYLVTEEKETHKIPFLHRKKIRFIIGGR